MQRGLFYESVGLGLEKVFKETTDQRQRETSLNLLLHFPTFLHIVSRASTNRRVALAHHGDRSHASFAQQFGDLVISQRIAARVLSSQIAPQTRARGGLTVAATSIAVGARTRRRAPRAALAHAKAAGGALWWARRQDLRRWGREIDASCRHGGPPFHKFDTQLSCFECSRLPCYGLKRCP